MKSIEDKYKQYKEDERKLFMIRRDSFVSKVSAVISCFWAFASLALIPIFVKLCIFVYGVDTSENHGATGALSVFGGGGVVALIGVLLYQFFCDESYFSLKSDIESKLSDSYETKHQKKVLLLEEKKREEFFKFYELYTTDADFKEQYDNQMLGRNEKDKKEFLEKLTDK